MNQITKPFARAGYDLAAIGEQPLPSTILYQGEPAGFFLPDGTISLLPETEPRRRELEQLAGDRPEVMAREFLAQKTQGRASGLPEQDITFLPALDSEVPEPEESPLEQQRIDAALRTFDSRVEQIGLLAGFNPEQEAAAREKLRRDFGTEDRAVLEQMLRTPVETVRDGGRPPLAEILRAAERERILHSGEKIQSPEIQRKGGESIGE